MKKIVQFQCEHCLKIYDTEQLAMQCEAKGVADLSQTPIGLMREYGHHRYVGIFAVGRIIHPDNNTHLAYANWCAARSPDYLQVGDSFDSMCGGDFVTPEQFKKHWFISDERVGGPEFERMVNFLVSKNIVPRYYDERGNLCEIFYGTSGQRIVQVKKNDVFECSGNAEWFAAIYSDVCGGGGPLIGFVTFEVCERGAVDGRCAA